MSELKYAVKTPVFEGPLDLLLDLITSRKLFVSDVSLAQVTDDFISYIDQHEEFPIGESAEFIVVASTLMLIKSRSLLPDLELSQEEEESIHDLENRLMIFARIKELSTGVRQIYGRRVIYEKSPSKNPVVVFSPDKKTDIKNLVAALESVLNSIPKKEVVPKATVKKMISLEEMIGNLTERISKASRLSFTQFAGAKGPMTHEKKVSIIVGFLAMLELVKRGAIQVRQEGREIEMINDKVGTPHYV